MRCSEQSLPSLCFWLCAVLIAPMWGVTATAQNQTSKVAAKHNLGVAGPAVPALPADLSAVLVSFAARAAVIFSGQVLAVTPSAGVVDIRFHVDNPIRNCPQNGDYVLREWAGLWTAHPDRYRVGQHVLLFLTARSSAGLSAPVDGNEGIVPLMATTQQPIADASGTAPADTSSTELTVDLRWLQTRVARTSAAPRLLHSLSTGGSRVQAWSGPVAPLAKGPATSLTSVIELLSQGDSDAPF